MYFVIGIAVHSAECCILSTVVEYHEVLQCLVLRTVTLNAAISGSTAHTPRTHMVRMSQERTNGVHTQKHCLWLRITKERGHSTAVVP